MADASTGTTTAVPGARTALSVAATITCKERAFATTREDVNSWGTWERTFVHPDGCEVVIRIPGAALAAITKDLTP